MSFPQKFVVADVETTGLQALLFRVIEIAYVVIENDDWSKFEIRTYRFTPGADDLRAASPKALEVNGYRHGHPDWEGAPLCGSPEAAEAWAAIRDDLRGAVMCNQNIPFDKGFIWHEIVRHRVQPHDDRPYSHDTTPDDCGIWERHHDEVMTYSRLLADRDGRKKYNLVVGYESLKGRPLPPHRAEADVLRALWVYAWGIEREQPVRAEAIRKAVIGWISRAMAAETVSLVPEEAALAGPLLQHVDNGPSAPAEPFHAPRIVLP